MGSAVLPFSTNYDIDYRGLGLDPKPIFYIYGWLIKIYGCFSVKPENCGEGIFRLQFLVVYQIYG